MNSLNSLNLVHLIGNLGQDPELRKTDRGITVVNLNIATNEVWNDNDGQRVTRTEWHRIVVFGKMAESCAKFLAKGRSVRIEGRLQTRKWTDSAGISRETTVVVAQRVHFLGARKAA